MVSLHLFCGCLRGLWNYLHSYVMKEGDSIELVESRFGVSNDNIETVIRIDNPDNITVDALYYIALSSVPSGEPYPILNNTPLHVLRYHLLMQLLQGGLDVGFALLIVVVALFVCLRSSIRFQNGQRNHLKDPENEQVSQKFHVIRTSSFLCGSGRLCCKSNEWEQTLKASSDRHTNIPKGSCYQKVDCNKK